MLLPLISRSLIYLLFKFHIDLRYRNEEITTHYLDFLTPTFFTRWHRPFNQTSFFFPNYLPSSYWFVSWFACRFFRLPSLLPRFHVLSLQRVFIQDDLQRTASLLGFERKNKRKDRVFKPRPPPNKHCQTSVYPQDHGVLAMLYKVTINKFF